MRPPIRLPLEIRIHPYLRDHRFEGRAVLPAVEAMRLLAASVQSQWPRRDVQVMTDASFSRFLFIEEGDESIGAVCDIQVDEQANRIASLSTLVPTAGGRMTRVKEHVRICFPQASPGIETLPFSAASRLDGACFEMMPEQLYEKPVPFGPAFQNVSGLLRLTEQGATAQVQAAIQQSDPGPLGSVFPLDAAFHCACAWGQRFAGMVAFPVGFAMRRIFRPIAAGDICFTRIIPVENERGALIFDLWIYNSGVPCEAVLGLVMRDVSNGRLKPPDWIRA